MGGERVLAPGGEAPPAPATAAAPAPDAGLPPSLIGRADRGSPPPLFGAIGDKATGRGDERPSASGAELPPALRGEPAPDGGLPPAPDGGLPPAPRVEPEPDAEFPPARHGELAPDAGKTPPGSPRTVTPEPPNVSLHLGPAQDRPTGASTPDAPTPDHRPDRPTAAPGAPASGAPASGAPASARRGSGAPAPDAPASAHPASGASASARPASGTSARRGSGAPAPNAPASARPASGASATGAPAPARPASGAPASGASASARPASGTSARRGSGAPASGAPAPAAPVPARPASGASASGAPASTRPTPGAPTPGSSTPSAPARPAPLDGNLHLKPVRRLRTEPSAEWTPHPSYGAEPGAGKGAVKKASAEREAQGTPARGPVDDPGPDTELDLVLDLAPGDRAASATFSVPVPVPASGTASGARTGTGSTTTTTAAPPPYPGRRHSVIANETTASIPVHLLFRDDQEPAEAAALPAAVVGRPAGGDRAPATRRPPVPRSPQTRVQPSTRPAPVADPRLAERPGPALPGYAALLVGAAGIAGGLAVLWWRGALPAAWQNAVGLIPRPDLGIGVGAWALLALLATVVLLALGGLGRGRVGYAWVLTLFGDYRGSVRRTGLVWVSPLLLRRRVDVRLRHWRSEPLPAVDANGTALRVVVLVVWRIKDTVRAVLGIEDHEAYLSAQVEAAMARVLSQLPADAFHEDAPSLRDAEAVGDALTRMLKADCEPVGVEVYSAQPTGIEYAPEVAAAMQRRRIAAIDSKHRDSVLTSVVDAVDDTVNRLTTRGIVELDDYERKALVKDLTVAFYTGRSGGGDGA
nr:SPFH domain-containing protein [Streptomyces sp. SID14515]